nr:F-box protein PP2-B10-like [Ipomoea batatas]
MAVENVTGADIFALPEICIANTLSLTTPKDACRLSLVASNFRSAAQFEAVWERFLPPDYRDLISRAANTGDLLAFTSKKDLYFHLCDHPIIIDCGTKSFSLDKASAKKCCMLAARSLDIAWGNDTNYWRWISFPGSRFSEVNELLQVWWFEIRGRISTKMLSPDTNYAAYLVFSARQNIYGFESQPVDALIRIIGQDAVTRMVYLDPKRALVRPRTKLGPWELDLREAERSWRMGQLGHQTGQNANPPPENHGEHPKGRGDRWMEVELGEIFIRGSEEEDWVEISLMEVHGGQPKGGIIVQGIEIRPK